jgi:DNA helicase-2/ATP-dependent DNA helicase PcrA
MSVPSRFLEEVPGPLIENLGGRARAVSSWATPGYPKSFGRRSESEFDGRHYNYEDESQEIHASPGSSQRSAPAKPFVASWMSKKPSPSNPPPSSDPEKPPESIDNIARFFGGKSGFGKPGSMPRPASSRPAMEIPAPSGAVHLKRGDRVRHSKYGEGTIQMREGDGEDAKLTVIFNRHGMKKLMERFANLQKV